MNYQETITIGMRVDAAVAKLDELSSTQLYGIIVAFTVAVSFFVLNGNGSNAPEAPAPPLPPKARRNVPKGPQPKWHILKWLNYAAVFCFGVSVASFCLNASSLLSQKSTLLQYLVGWSVFLCYFFGFFGISFVDADELILSQEAAAAAVSESTTSRSISNAKDGPGATSTPLVSPVKKAPLHPPAYSAPICVDKSSLKPSPTKDIRNMDNEAIEKLLRTKQLKDHELEKKLDPHRAVVIRRLYMDSKLDELGRGGAVHKIPQGPSLDYSRVHGANCEIVVGYIPLPVGMVGPLTLNDESVYVPMATTEGCLVASTNRGAKAVTQGGGAVATIVRDGITRAPCVRMKSAKEAANLKLWCEEPENFACLKKAFESTTSFGKLKSCNPTVAGKNVYLRLVCFAGDAMGMNMVSKGSLAVIDLLREEFPTLSLVALSGNMCTDKKAAATNWIEGRGKSVVVEATIPKEVVRTTLKTSVKAIVETNVHKNLVGSAMASTVGGFNAHASNIVTAVFLATGQDPAQNVESSNCITLLEETDEGNLWISCTMPSIEVGTVGGGTSLPAQAACLETIGCKGGGATPGDNSKQLARVVAAATLCGELSLLAALAANTLVQAHMTHNRKPHGRK